MVSVANASRFQRGLLVELGWPSMQGVARNVLLLLFSPPVLWLSSFQAPFVAILIDSGGYFEQVAVCRQCRWGVSGKTVGLDLSSGTNAVALTIFRRALDIRFASGVPWL